MAHRERFGVVATLAALALASCASAIVPHTPTARTSTALTLPPVVTQGCVASDFKVGNGGSGAYQGDAVYSMVLLNISGIACAVTERHR